MPSATSYPAYGSPEWKAERAKMVGTPEWRLANNRATLDESVKFKTDEAIRDWIDYEISQGKDRPTASQIAARRSELEPNFRRILSPSADPQDQKMMTGANILTRINDQGEKEFYYGQNPLRQDAPHSELYNRLLQSGGMKEGIPVDPWSLGGKYNPGPQAQSYQSPSTAYQQPQTSGVPSTNPNVPTVPNPVETPTWKPPVQTPNTNQGTLFNQGNNGGASVPSWQPPSMGQNPSLGTNTNQNRNQPTSRYQSPSSRYARNQMNF